MVKRRSLVLVMLAMVLLSCGSREAKALRDYLEQIGEAQVHADRVGRARTKLQAWLDAPEGPPPVDLVRGELLPAQKAYVEALDAIRPDDPPIEAAHKLLVRGERQRLNGVYEAESTLLPGVGEAQFRQGVGMLLVAETGANADRAAWAVSLEPLCRDRKLACPQ